MGFWSATLDMFTGGVSKRALSGGRAYDAGRNDLPETVNWYAPLTSGVDEVLDNKDQVTRRARDLVRNHPIISGAMDRRAESVVGANIRLETQPVFEAMGLDADWADEWSTQAEAQFELWARDPRKLCDAEMQLQFGGMTDLAYRHWMQDGEATAIIKMLPPNGPRAGARLETCVELIDPDRVSNPRGMPDYSRLPNGRTLIGGIEYDRNKAPVAAHVRVAHPAQSGAFGADTFRWVRVPFYNRMGRPIFIHAMRRKRADQRRGMSQLVAALTRIKMLDRYDKAEIEAAILNSVMAAWIESPYPTGDVAASMSTAPTSENGGGNGWSLADQLAYRKDRPVRLEGVRTWHGLPGEKLSLNRAEHPSQNYPDFQAAGLRSIAASLGISYAQLAQNWSDINYSSARAMLNEIWRGLLHDRWLFTQAFCTPIWLAVCEEMAAKGLIDIPGGPMNFYRYRTELSMCEWVGPGRGTVDPLKEKQAYDFGLNQGTDDLTTLSNEQGRDYRKTLRNQHREKLYRERLGLAPFVPLRRSGASSPDTEQQDQSREAAEQQVEEMQE